MAAARSLTRSWERSREAMMRREPEEIRQAVAAVAYMCMYV
jgi:hypothetical protein